MYDLSWLNRTPHAIAVYASRPLSPVAPQHSLPSGRYSLLGPDLHRQDRASFAWRTYSITSSAMARSSWRRAWPLQAFSRDVLQTEGFHAQNRRAHTRRLDQSARSLRRNLQTRRTQKLRRGPRRLPSFPRNASFTVAMSRSITHPFTALTVAASLCRSVRLAAVADWGWRRCWRGC